MRRRGLLTGLLLLGGAAGALVLSLAVQSQVIQEAPLALTTRSAEAGDPAASVPVARPQEANVQALAPAVVRTVDVPGASWKGRVVDPQGQPLAGARIGRLARARTLHLMSHGPAPENPALFRQSAWSETDGEGRFEMPWTAPPADTDWALLVLHERGQATALLCTDALSSGGNCGTIRVAAAALAQGRVLRADGSPAVGAQVEARLLPYGVELVAGDPGLLIYAVGLREGLLRTHTDAAGRFALGSLPAASLTLRVEHLAHAPLESESSSLVAGMVLDLGDLQMSRGHSVAGRVLDSEGRPIAGAEVRATPRDLEVLAIWDHGIHFELEQARSGGGDRRGRPEALACVTSSDADGRFEVAGLARDWCAIVAAAEGFEPSAVDGVPAGRSDVELRLDRLGELRLRLVDAVDGKLLTAAELTVQRVAHGTFEPVPGEDVLPVQQVEPGVFLVRDVCAAPLVGSVHEPARGVLGLRLPGLPSGSVQEDREISVPRAASVEGRVLDTAGEPLEGARVFLRPHGSDRQPLRTDAIEVAVAPDGRFHGGPVPADDWMVSASATDHVVTTLRAELSPGESRAVGDLVVQRAAAVEVRLHGNSGEPLAKVHLALVEADQSSGKASTLVSGSTDSEGWLRLACRPGAARLESQDARIGVDLGVLGEGETRSLVLRPSGPARLSGTVSDPAGALPGATVAFGGRFGSVKATCDAEGRWALEVPGVAAGTLTARSPRGGVVSRELSATDYATGVDLQFGGDVLRGRVVDSGTGVGLGGVSVQAWRPRGVPGVSVRTDADGLFELGNLSGGAWIVQAGGGGWSFTAKTSVSVPAPEVVVVAISRLATVAGTVRLVSGASVPRFTCDVYLLSLESDDHPERDFPDESGAFGFKSVPPGNYALFVTRDADGHEMAFDRKRLERLAWLRVDLRIAPGETICQDLLLPPDRP